VIKLALIAILDHEQENSSAVLQNLHSIAGRDVGLRGNWIDGELHEQLPATSHFHFVGTATLDERKPEEHPQRGNVT
jgi:hypothetical protein